MSHVLRGVLRNLHREAAVFTLNNARYTDILERSLQISEVMQALLATTRKTSAQNIGPRIAFMASPGRDYIEATLAAWLCQGIAVPLSPSHPQQELEYFLEDAQPSAVLSSSDYWEKLEPLTQSLGLQHCRLGEQGDNLDEGEIAQRAEEASAKCKEADGSLIIYTSGTTGRPKGALHTHRSINAQVSGLCSSWEWQMEDRILHCLPLHHVHGIVNALYCPMTVGATVEFLPKFSPSEVWRHLMRDEEPVTVFMGVPTMYNYLLSHYRDLSSEDQKAAQKAATRLRLTVSGSAACPIPIMNEWEELSGMLLSNKYRGERKAGFVGYPLPGVSTKLRDDGELAVKGEMMFKEYWNKRDATAESFDDEGYFLTGDTAETVGEDRCWKILGRTSTDIINSGGYKISALQIEDALLEHPGVSNCAVVGTEDDALGEAICAVISCDKAQVTEAEVKDFAGQRLPKYQVPHRVVVLTEIPRNAMGKLNKKALKKDLKL